MTNAPHMYVCSGKLKYLANIFLIRTYGTAQLQLELATCVHAWHHGKISPRPVTCLHGPRLYVACNTHVTCNLMWGHACKLLYMRGIIHTHGT